MKHHSKIIEVYGFTSFYFKTSCLPPFRMKPFEDEICFWKNLLLILKGDKNQNGTIACSENVPIYFKISPI